MQCTTDHGWKLTTLHKLFDFQRDGNVGCKWNKSFIWLADIKGLWKFTWEKGLKREDTLGRKGKHRSLFSYCTVQIHHLQQKQWQLCCSSTAKQSSIRCHVRKTYKIIYNLEQQEESMSKKC